MAEYKARPRVVIADDHPEMVTRAAALLREDFDVVGIAHDGTAALECIRRLDPDVALLDLYMPGLSGIEVIRTLRTSGSRTVAVIMTGYNDSDLASAAIAAGAMAFVTKVQLIDDLLPAMRAAVQGTIFVSPSRITKGS